MDWKKSNTKEKVKFLTEQLAQIKQARALLERYEQFTEKWLKRLGEGKGKK